MPTQGRKFVIIGGAGLVGSALAHNLISTHSADVIICDAIGNVGNGKWANLPSAVDDFWPCYGLLTNLDKAWREIAGVLVLADFGHDTGDGDDVFEAAYHLPRRVWDFCTAKQRPFFWASTAHVYGSGLSQLSREPKDIAALKPMTAFGVAKQAFDVFAARQGTGPDTPPIWTGMRLSSVYGKGEEHKGALASLPMRAMAHAKAGTSLNIWPDSGKVTRDWVHVSDAAATIAALATGEHAGFFDIGTGVATDTTQLVAQVEAVSGKALNITTNQTAVPPPVSLALADISALNAVGIPIQFRGLQQGLADL